MGRLVTALVLAALAAAAPGSASGDTALPGAPLTMRVSALAAGREASIRLEPAGAEPGAGSFDLYLVRIPSGPPILRFLSPAGTWSTTPMPYRRDVQSGPAAPITAEWREEGPPGFVTVVAVLVRPGASPGDRLAWRSQPLMTRCRVGADGGWTGAVGALAPLGLATLLGLTLVIVLPRGPQ